MLDISYPPFRAERSLFHEIAVLRCDKVKCHIRMAFLISNSNSKQCINPFHVFLFVFLRGVI